MTVQEASHLWFFESHNNSKRSQWLQSTLSELEEKTKGMLKLIEGDADTFAQRAEMYYKKRPELVNMIEDFYRSHRSLAERYDQLKLELVNRGTSLKEWSFIDKPSAASSLLFDSESEVDDPSEGEEEQVDSKLREVPENKNFTGMFKVVGVKRERSEEVLTYSFDSEPSEVSYPELEETQVKSRNEYNLVEISDRKRDYLSHPLADIVKSKIENINYERDDAKKVMKEVERLKVELEMKDEEKREVIRQLSFSVDLLRGENDDMKRFIRDSNNRSSSLGIRKLKGVFSKNLFNFSTPLVAL